MKKFFKAFLALIVSILEHSITPISYTGLQPQGKMAKIKFGMMMTDARNKLGGQVFSKNRGGAYIRTKVTPVNPSSVAQALVRGIFTFFSQAWRSLTAAERTAWNAATSNFTTTDIFADVRTPSGLNLYKKLNQNLILVGAGAITTPPLPQTIENVPLDSITADFSAQSLSLAAAGGPVPANHTLVIEATPALSAGVSFVESEFRVIGYRAAAVTYPIVASADYIAKFGAVGAAGSKVFVRTKCINLTSGQASAYTKASTIVVP